ncbi:AAA family ATPase [Spiroplasma poulsonii]|uniref:AAA family ATPase n=1 Tax=Spiroplasma poulsonii TaxID=2138 RepID=UPI0038D4946D
MNTKNLINSIKLSELLSEFKNYLIINNILQIQEIKNQNNILNTKYLLRIENVTINDSKQEVNISDGQKKIICLRNYLKVDKDIYLLDEPEASLDNSTIMTSIINEMHDLGKIGKTVIIATHNSNIAVYTKPLNLIYRE